MARPRRSRGVRRGQKSSGPGMLAVGVVLGAGLFGGAVFLFTRAEHERRQGRGANGSSPEMRRVDQIGKAVGEILEEEVAKANREPQSPSREASPDQATAKPKASAQFAAEYQFLGGGWKPMSLRLAKSWAEPSITRYARVGSPLSDEKVRELMDFLRKSTDRIAKDLHRLLSLGRDKGIPEALAFKAIGAMAPGGDLKYWDWSHAKPGAMEEAFLEFAEREKAVERANAQVDRVIADLAGK